MTCPVGFTCQCRDMSIIRKKTIRVSSSTRCRDTKWFDHQTWEAAMVAVLVVFLCSRVRVNFEHKQTRTRIACHSIHTCGWAHFWWLFAYMMCVFVSTSYNLRRRSREHNAHTWPIDLSLIYGSIMYVMTHMRYWVFVALRYGTSLVNTHKYARIIYI